MRILTFALCLLCFSVSAQNNSINVYPWNPDSDHDNQIGVEDLQSFLTVYGNDFGLPPEPCTYDGTELEDWIIGVLSDSIILDSVYFDMTFSDNGQYFVPGCPEPIIDTMVVYNYGMLNNGGNFTGYVSGVDAWGGGVNCHISFLDDTGEMVFTLRFNSLAGDISAPSGFFSTYCSPWQLQWRGALPVDTMSASFSIDGALDFDFSINNPWYGNSSTWSCNFDSYLDSIYILPYWHYADE
jgi:hypothetical protein